MKRSLVYAAVLPAALAPSCTQHGRTEGPPNVVIILADDLGYGDLGCYGARNVETPNVDRLAGQGVRLTQAYATASVSTPSRYSLLTGEYAWRRSDTDIAVGDAGMIIRPGQYSLADVFADMGYATGAFGKWHLGLGEKGGEQDWNAPLPTGLADIGFRESYIMAATGDRVPCVFIENGRVAGYDPSAPIEVSYERPFEGEPLAKDHPELLYNLQSTPGVGHNQAIVNGIGRIGYMKGGGKALWKDENIADSITVHALDFMERHKDEPFFVYLATNDIHVPRFPHERFRGRSGMGLRGDAIAEFDWTVGAVMDRLERLGVADNTLLIVTSDNGPVLEDGYQDQARELLNGHSPSGALRGNKYGVYEAGARVPAIRPLARPHRCRDPVGGTCFPGRPVRFPGPPAGRGPSTRSGARQPGRPGRVAGAGPGGTALRRGAGQQPHALGPDAPVEVCRAFGRTGRIPVGPGLRTGIQTLPATLRPLRRPARAAECRR